MRGRVSSRGRWRSGQKHSAPPVWPYRGRAAMERDKEYDEGGVMIDRKWKTLSYFVLLDGLFFRCFQLFPQPGAQRQKRRRSPVLGHIARDESTAGKCIYGIQRAISPPNAPITRIGASNAVATAERPRSMRYRTAYSGKSASCISAHWRRCCMRSGPAVESMVGKYMPPPVLTL